MVAGAHFQGFAHKAFGQEAYQCAASVHQNSSGVFARARRVA